MSNCPTCNVIKAASVTKELERISKLTPDEIAYEKTIEDANIAYKIEEEKAIANSLILRQQAIQLLEEQEKQIRISLDIELEPAKIIRDKTIEEAALLLNKKE